MSRLGTALSSGGFVLGVAIMLSASDQRTEAQRAGTNAPAAGAPSSIPMGGNKSVTRFFVTPGRTRTARFGQGPRRR
jgi:hypothetical protein